MCDLLAELFSIESDFKSDKAKQMQGLELLVNARSGSSLVLVAEAGDEVIGMCSVQTLISTAEGGPAGFVEDLIVRRRCRRNGIATGLLNKMLSWCRTRGISRLHLIADKDNGQALTYYEGRGWDVTNLICLRKYL
jgi:GNAT superfamily N-acetyltransferase